MFIPGPKSAALALILVLSACIKPLHAQITATTTEPVVDGNTVIVVYSTDVVGNTIATQTISTIIADAALATSAAVSTTDPFGGVVPSTTVAVQVTVTNPLGPAPPTTFVYTTIVGGVTQEVTDVYTPTYQPAVMSVSLRTGTIWAYSDYTALYGPTKASDSSSRRNLVSDSFGLISSIVAMAAGILVGVRVVGVL